MSLVLRICVTIAIAKLRLCGVALTQKGNYSESVDIYRKYFGERLRRALEAIGQNQAWLADKLEVKPATVSRWVNGKDFPTRERLETIARFLEVSVDDLVGAPSTESLAPADTKQSLEHKIQLTLDEMAQILPKILSKKPIERAMILYMITRDRRFFDALPADARRAFRSLQEERRA